MSFHGERPAMKQDCSMQATHQGNEQIHTQNLRSMKLYIRFISVSLTIPWMPSVENKTVKPYNLSFARINKGISKLTRKQSPNSKTNRNIGINIGIIKQNQTRSTPLCAHDGVYVDGMSGLWTEQISKERRHNAKSWNQHVSERRWRCSKPVLCKLLCFTPAKSLQTPPAGVS